jgi:hypothetical protein
MATTDIGLMAHLLRRAGFGASPEELEAYAARDYEAVVEDLLHPDGAPDIDEDLLQRYFMPALYHENSPELAANWIYRMINTKRPLQEKMALFWHGVFATGWDKGSHSPSSVAQIATFRRNGLDDLRTILLDLSRDPAMLYWLDNEESHKNEPNENYGRELLELFSMGVGNYTEEDIKDAARAFTGWTYEQPIPIFPYGMCPTRFVYQPEDHDDGEKTFLGKPAASTVTTSSTSSSAIRPPPASSPATSTTSSSLTSRRCRRGISCRRVTPRRSMRCAERISTRTAASAR